MKRETKVGEAEVKAAREAKEATQEQLVAEFNQQARAIRSVNAGVELKAIAGSAYSGVIEEYREVKGFLLAQRPGWIRVIGQAPVVGKNIFDMVSDGETFRIYIPSKNKFIEGPAQLAKKSEKAIENVRPQHLVDAIFWREFADGSPLVMEEAEEGAALFYVLTELRRRVLRGFEDNPETWEIVRKVWFERAELTVARVQMYGNGGKVVSDVRYRQWEPVSDVKFAKEMVMRRPVEDYGLEIRVTKLTLNEAIERERFELKQPEGVEVVKLGDKVD